MMLNKRQPRWQESWKLWNCFHQKSKKDVWWVISPLSLDELIVPLDLPDSLTYYWWFVSWFGNRLHPEWVQIVYSKERWCWHSPLRVDFSAMACLPCISLHKQNIPMPSCSRLLVPIPIMNSRKQLISVNSYNSFNHKS